MKFKLENNIYEKAYTGKDLASYLETSSDCSDRIILAAKIHNKLYELHHIPSKEDLVEWVPLEDRDGQRIYQRTLIFVLLKAIRDLGYDEDLVVQHSLSKGLYCEFNSQMNISKDQIKNIKIMMQNIIDKNMPIHKEYVLNERAIEIFKDLGLCPKLEIMKYRDAQGINLYRSEDLYNYFYGYMAPSTGYVKVFDVLKYDKGLILRFPVPLSNGIIPEFIESPKIAEVFSERDAWAKILNISYVTDLNKKAEEGTFKEIVQVVEALHDKDIAKIADQIYEQKRRVVLIAGPSSSGKTTFSKKLKIQLKVLGLDPITMSTDDYFVDRELTPKDENGNYDFECLEAVDVELFNEQIESLIDGLPVKLPKFDFKEGKKYFDTEYTQIKEHQPIIIEGIHGLNEKLTGSIYRKDKFKIYISALTQLNIDAHNRIPTTQARLLRRIVRDHNFRGHSAEATIKMWDSVRRGEEKYIFPYQEEADIVFNSALPYELSVLKEYAYPLLQAIDEDDPSFIEANLLIKFLGYFTAYKMTDVIPNTSILREFIGGSCFEE